jgi:hypothetical protein
MRCTILMLVKLDLVLERAIQSIELIVKLDLVLERAIQSIELIKLYIKNIQFVVMKDIKNIESSKDTTNLGCDARVHFSVSRERVLTVQKAILDHNNHYLASPNMKQITQIEVSTTSFDAD